MSSSLCCSKVKGQVIQQHLHPQARLGCGWSHCCPSDMSHIKSGGNGAVAFDSRYDCEDSGFKSGCWHKSRKCDVAFPSTSCCFKSCGHCLSASSAPVSLNIETWGQNIDELFYFQPINQTKLKICIIHCDLTTYCRWLIHHKTIIKWLFGWEELWEMKEVSWWR